jgi:hypothetical protein
MSIKRNDWMVIGATTSTSALQQGPNYSPLWIGGEGLQACTVWDASPTDFLSVTNMAIAVFSLFKPRNFSSPNRYWYVPSCLLYLIF